MSDGRIDPSARVAEGARLAAGVCVGPYAVIEAGAELAEGCVIGAHAVIGAACRLASGVQVYPHAVLGLAPQHSTADGAGGRVVVGAGTVLREFVTVHRPIEPGGETRIGAGCLLMVGAHVAHDCRVGDRVVLTNAAHLGGHVEVGDDAVIGGLVGVHQFVRIGRGAMIAAHAMVRKDILPFSLAAGQPARHQRLNTVGLRRRGVSEAARRALEAAFRACRAGRRPEADGTVPEVAVLLAFLSAPSRRGLAGFARPGARVQAD